MTGAGLRSSPGVSLGSERAAPAERGTGKLLLMWRPFGVWCRGTPAFVGSYWSLVPGNFCLCGDPLELDTGKLLLMWRPFGVGYRETLGFLGELLEFGAGELLLLWGAFGVWCRGTLGFWGEPLGFGMGELLRLRGGSGMGKQPPRGGGGCCLKWPELGTPVFSSLMASRHPAAGLLKPSGSPWG